eukprot:TRINITY_DN6982_c0_g1_i1.p1 TRINITY_DN6982_c0_g1~~TRINITY_DN6982_c0_g1_i1.p1  ORF type:complete len:570 (+),score=164.02 TRINITY_DN6982_c0_g1_i1:69-1778(+)
MDPLGALAKSNGTAKLTDSTTNKANNNTNSNPSIKQTPTPPQTSSNNIAPNSNPLSTSISQDNAENQLPDLKAFFQPLLETPKLDLKRHLYTTKREESVEPSVESTVPDEPSTPELPSAEPSATETLPSEEKDDKSSASDEMTPTHELIATLSAQEAQLYSAMATSPEEERRRGSKHDTRETVNEVQASEGDLNALNKEQLIAMIHELQADKQRLEDELSDLDLASPTTVIKLMRKGAVYPIDHLKSYSAKARLLDAAVRARDSNTLLNTVLYLKRTLSMSLFIGLLNEKQAALHMYLNFLKSRFNYTELIWIYHSLNQPYNQGKTMLLQAYMQQHTSARVTALQSCLDFFNKHAVLFKTHIASVKDQIELLTRQSKIENVDSQLARTDKVFQRYPRETVVHKPLVNTLFYVLFYHPNDPVERVGSPLALKKAFKVTEKRYLYTSLLARSRAQDWNGVKQLVEHRGFFALSIKSCIGFGPFVEVLSRCQAPPKLMQFFAQQIQPFEERLRVCVKCKQWALGVEAAVQSQSHALVEQLDALITREMGPYGVIYHNQLQKALADPNIKWKS